MKFSLYCCSPSPKPRGSRTLQKNDESTMVSIRSISQISLPQIQRKRKPWVYQDDYEFLKDQGRVYRLNDDDSSPYINRKQQAVKLIQQIDYSDPTDIEERFSFVLKYLKQTRIGNIYNLGVYAFAMVLQMNNLFEKSIAVWQKFLVFCNGNRAFKYKMIAYKYLTELYILEHDLKRALNYSKKLLKYALCFKEYEYELNAYELIGKIYYYQQKAQLAKAFHEKFMEGEQLSDNNQVRIQAKKLFDFRIKQQQSLGKIDTDSDEEFEITELVEPKELSFNPVKLKDVLIKNKHLWGHVRKDSVPLGPINRSVLDKKLFQREYYTQLSHNNSLQKYMNNNTAIAGCKNQYLIFNNFEFNDIMSVYIWGSTPTQEETSTPKQITINFPITKVSCGEEHMLMLSNTNQLYSLGTNSFGVLGIGSDDYSERSLTPQLIQSNVIDMDCGWNHNVALNINNNAFVWGRVSYDITQPKQVGQSIRFVKCGARHTMMINNKNQLFAIGANDSGQCGIQNNKKINDLTHVMDNVLTVACGVSHTLIKVNQQLLACGSNTLGQLGIQGLKSTATPALVDLPKVDQIAAGNHSAAISNGNLYIWGSGCFGNYSKPTLFIRDMVDVKVNGTLGIGLNNQGDLYTWGSNVNGELGVGDTSTRNEPVKVLKNISHFGVGVNYAIAITRPPQPVTTEKEYLAKTLQIESEERTALEKINRELKSKFVELEQCNMDLRKLLDQKNDDIKQLQEQLEQTMNTGATSDSLVKDLKQQCQRHQTFQKDAISKIEKYEEYIDEIESQLKQKTEECEGLQNQLQNFQENLKQYQSDENQQLQLFKNQLSELTEQLNYEQQVNEQLMDQYTKEKEQFQQRNVLIQQYEFEIGNLQSQSKTYANQITSSLSQHQKLAEGLTVANHRIESLQTQNAKLMQELSLLRTSLYSDMQKPQVLEIQTIMGLNKELTELNNQLQIKMREKDTEIIKLKSQLGNQSMLKESRQSQQSQMKNSSYQNQLSQQNLNIIKSNRQDSPNGKTIQELLESAHKHAKYMKKILKSSENFESDTPSPKRKLEFSKENSLMKNNSSLIKNDSLSEVRERLNKLQQNKQLYDQKLRI